MENGSWRCLGSFVFLRDLDPAHPLAVPRKMVRVLQDDLCEADRRPEDAPGVEALLKWGPNRRSTRSKASALFEKKHLHVVELTTCAT